MGWLFGRGGQNDILALHPTVVTTCYGMNDGGYRAINEQTLNAYRDGMKRLVTTFKENGVRTVVVGSPGAVDSGRYHGGGKDAEVYNQTLAALRDVARDVAKENGFPFADVHDVMMDVMAKVKAKYGAEYPFAGTDGVHPTSSGHLVMAYAFLKAMGCEGEIGTITVDMAGGKASASDGHKVVSAAEGSVVVESSRYPFCFWGNASDPNGTSGIVEFFPFNEDLNRLKLVVSGAPAGQVKVTWGGASKVYSSEQLAKGVNLAADFVQNPFSEQFGKVREAVRRKQEFETGLYKSFLAGSKTMQEALRESNPQSDAYEQLKAAMLKHDAKLAGEVAAQVVPVTHTIKVEVVR